MSAPRTVTMASVRQLKPSKFKAHTHSKKQIRQLADVIRRVGWTYPILTDADGSIIAGSARHQAALLLGLTDVPVIVMTGLSDAERRALAIADNKIAANAGWDRAALAAELGELAILLPECDLSLDFTGFEPAELDSLFGDFSDPEIDPADGIPSIEQQATSALGDLWILGGHRLLCGNSLVADDIHELMGAELARMVVADAPYNVAINSIVGRGRTKYREFKQASGELSPGQFAGFLRNAMILACQHSNSGAMALWFVDWRHLNEMLSAGTRIYGDLKNLIVWNKSNGGQGSLYRSKHELIFLYKKGNAPHTNNVELGRHGRNRTNVWDYASVNTFQIGQSDNTGIHPTAKPVAMIADAMRDLSRRDDIILDPFIGSGTTILAAERVGRRAYGLEIDPLYVDAAIRRWQAFTKRDAILKATGQTFDEVCEARTAPVKARVSR